jgi:uncharacterized protein YbjT (DUF2867 family)
MKSQDRFQGTATRRAMVACSFLLIFPSKSLLSTLNKNLKHKILVLGDKGFLGQQIVHQLDELRIPYVTASKRSGVDLTSPTAAGQVEQLCRQHQCDAVISTVGSIGNSEDELINASNSVAAKGAKQSGVVKRFVAIGNDPKVRAFSKSLPPLQNYAKGKETSEQAIMEYFPDSFTIVQPSFIHGGKEFSISPPRVPSAVGQAAEDMLGLYPLQAASEALPGVLGIFLQAPMSRDRVAAAAINAALGLAQGRLDSRDAIILAASKRPAKEIMECKVDEPIGQLKQDLYALGDCGGDAANLQKAFEILEKIENCNDAKPATDLILNGRWDFVFDVEADMGTGVVKDFMEGNSPAKAVFDMKDLYMEIGYNNRQVKIFVKTAVLGIPVNLELTTAILPEASDPSGTTFLETFQGIKLMGIEMPVPKGWQRSRPLEFSYMDENMLIARGNGGEPHYLKR